MSTPAGTSQVPDGPPAGREHHHQERHRMALRVLTAITLVTAYLLVLLGDTVRVTESGMGCRSWPLCNGHLGLTGTIHALLEQSHRYLAAIVTVLVVATFVVSWRQARRHSLVFRAASAALVLIGIQIVLGAVTVFLQNAGWTVALHLAGAWLVVGAVTVATVGAWRAPSAGGSRGGAWQQIPAGRLGITAAASLFVLSVTGMLVLHEGASDACPAWPVCGWGTAPPHLVVLQYLHRSMALLTAVIIVAAAWRAWRSAPARVPGRVFAAVAVVLLAATVAFGAVVATTGAPPAVQALHLAMASALWITVVLLATPGSPGQQRQALPDRHISRV